MGGVQRPGQPSLGDEHPDGRLVVEKFSAKLLEDHQFVKSAQSTQDRQIDDAHAPASKLGDETVPTELATHFRDQRAQKHLPRLLDVISSHGGTIALLRL